MGMHGCRHLYLPYNVQVVVGIQHEADHQVSVAPHLPRHTGHRLSTTRMIMRSSGHSSHPPSSTRGRMGQYDDTAHGTAKTIA
jgi:hypothetical protein